MPWRIQLRHHPLKRLEALRIERSSDGFGHDFQCARHRNCGAVRALGGDRVEDVGGRDDSRLERNLGGVQATRVALAVEPFVVRRRHASQLAELRDAAQDFFGEGRVLTDRCLGRTTTRE